VLGFYLIAAHLVGDFLLQDRWTAAAKAASRTVRAVHVGVYLLPFAALAAYATAGWRIAGFLVLLAGSHYLVDSRRFGSSLGDVAYWTFARLADPAEAARAWVEHLYGGATTVPLLTPAELRKAIARRREQARGITGRTLLLPPPNPWPGTGFAVDQVLHVASLAVLAGIFLR
jgi:Protein of unknown function (DUF3307)